MFAWRRISRTQRGPQRRIDTDFRPGVERLECRRLLATVSTWTGRNSNLWSDIGNWTAGVPGVAPNPAGDEATFNNTSAVNATLDVPASVGMLTINGYTGTLTLDFPLNVTFGSMSSGTINGAGNLAIRLNTGFDWTGGTIGGSGILYVRAGAKVLLAGTTVTLNRQMDNSGTVTFTNGVTMVVGGVPINNTGTIEFKPTAAGQSPTISNGGNDLLTNQGTVTKNDTNGGGATIQMAFVNNAANSKLEIRSGTLNFTSTASQSSGDTNILPDTTLALTGNVAAKQKYTMSGGTFESGAGSSSITGTLEVTGGNVYPGGNGDYGLLAISKDYSQSGGTLNIDYKVDASGFVLIGQDRITCDTPRLGGALVINTSGSPINNGNPYTSMITGTNPIVGGFASKSRSYNGIHGAGYWFDTLGGDNSWYNVYAMAGAPLRAQGSAAGGGQTSVPLRQQDVAAVFAAAEARWSAVLGRPRVAAALDGVRVETTDLSDGQVGLATPGVLLLDKSASGYGWFVDPTPSDDAEFAPVSAADGVASVGSPAFGRIDLLTVLAHEMGHLLGFEHSAASGDVMEAALAPGQRSLPSTQDAGPLAPDTATALVAVPQGRPAFAVPAALDTGGVQTPGATATTSAGAHAVAASAGPAFVPEPSRRRGDSAASASADLFFRSLDSDAVRFGVADPLAVLRV